MYDHVQTWIAVPIDPSHHMPIRLSTIYHAPLEIYMWHSFL